MIGSELVCQHLKFLFDKKYRLHFSLIKKIELRKKTDLIIKNRLYLIISTNFDYTILVI